MLFTTWASHTIKKKILITGINGQDGAFLAQLAINNELEVIGVQRPLPDYREKQFVYRLEKLNIYDNITFEVLDLTLEKNCDYLFKKYNPFYFSHLGSQSSVVKGDTHKTLTIENELISENLINSLTRYSQDTKMFFPSSATIYEGYQNKTVNEKTLPKPLTTYSQTKYNTHRKLKNLIDKKKLNGSIGIMFSHESEFRRPNFFSKTIVEFLAKYIQNEAKNLTVGNILIQRDIGYAKQYVEAIFKIMQSSKCDEFIVSSNKLDSLKDFITTCLNLLEINYEILQSKENIIFIDKSTGKPFIESNPAKYREVDLHGIKGDNTKILNEIGWSPDYSLQKICSKMINYELKQKKG